MIDQVQQATQDAHQLQPWAAVIIAALVQFGIAIWNISKVSTLVEVGRDAVRKLEERLNKIDDEKVSLDLHQERHNSIDREMQRNRHDIKGAVQLFAGLDQRVHVLEARSPNRRDPGR